MDMTVDEEEFIIVRGWYSEADVFWKYCEQLSCGQTGISISGHQQVWLRAQGRKHSTEFPTVYVIVKVGTHNAFKATIAKGEVV